MWPFRKDKVDITGMPPEVHEYYQAETRERVGVAWVLAFGTLLVTVVVALGGFFGGRTLYRKVVKQNKSPQTTVATTTEKKPEVVTSTPTGTGNTNSTNTTQNPTQSTGQVSDRAAVTTTPSPAKSTPSVQLPHTGPDGDD